MPRLHCRALMSVVALAAVSTALAASPADDARRHFETIAAGDLARLSRDYADDALLHWVGGPLDGTYSGAEAIRGVWERFTRAQGPLKLAVSDVQESSNPQGSTVSANVLFEGRQPIPVRYILVYRGGRLVGETWQVDPKLAVTPR